METPIGPAEIPELVSEHQLYTGKVRHTFSSSNADSLSLREVLEFTDEETKSLWDNMVLKYTENAGNPLLRKEVAKLHGVEAEDVLITCPREGLYIGMHSLVRYVKRKYQTSSVQAVSVFPAFQPLNDDLRLAGVNINYWRVKFTAEDGWHFCVDELRSLIQKETRILVVNFPHNPTGATLSPQQWEELFQICRSNDLFLVSDEMYRSSEMDSSSPPPSACAVYDNAITLCGMSKTLALPGLRIGWLCTKNKEVMSCLKKYKDFTTNCSPGICQLLSLMALRNIDHILDRTRDVMMYNLPLWETFLSKHSDIFEWKAPKAGTVTLVKLIGWMAELGGATAFCRKAAKEAGLVISPASNYMYGENYIRISMVAKELAAGLVELEKYLDVVKPNAQK